MTVLRVVLAVAGGLLVVCVLGSVVTTLVVPRGGVGRISRWTGRVVDHATGLLLRTRRSGRTRDRLLGTQAPAYLMTLLVTWMVLLALGYTGLLLPLTRSFSLAAEEAVSSLLTLGFVKSGGPVATLIDFVAAGTGLLTVALLVGYLPTIYGAYNRRETEITLLDARAGSPPWGPELLARTHIGIQGESELVDFYRTWERWGADVAETHVSYSSLLWFRSPNPATHWTVSMLAVLDSAAMYHAVAPSRAPTTARLALRMGFVALQDIADSLGIAHDADPRPDAPVALTREEFEDGLARLRLVGFPLERDGDEAWAHFRGWRVNYESIAYTLTSMTDAPAARWSGPRRRTAAAVAARYVVNRSPDNPDGSLVRVAGASGVTGPVGAPGVEVPTGDREGDAGTVAGPGRSTADPVV